MYEYAFFDKFYGCRLSHIHFSALKIVGLEMILNLIRPVLNLRHARTQAVGGFSRMLEDFRTKAFPNTCAADRDRDQNTGRETVAARK